MLLLSDIMTRFRDLFFLSVFLILLTAVIWIPHYFAFSNFLGLHFTNGFATIFRNYDGLEYVIIAKSWYSPQVIGKLSPIISANYYAAHFPGYPFVIWLLAPLLGYLKSMLVTSMLFTLFSGWMFYLLVKDFKLTNHPLFLSFIFYILPARWLIVHSVGSAEPMFIFFVISSIYFFLKATKENLIAYPSLFISAAAAMGAQLTRPPGILLGFAYLIYVLWQAYSQKKGILYILRFFPFILIPLTLLGIFFWFGIAYNDFWAYFHSGDNIHLTLPPFAVFNKDQYWVGSIWLEDIIYIFILGFLGSLMLLKQNQLIMGIFSFIYLFASLFIAHRDISRYTLPVSAFIIIAFEKILTSKEFKIVITILVLGIYLYSQNFILNNTAPIPNLSIYQ